MSPSIENIKAFVSRNKVPTAAVSGLAAIAIITGSVIAVDNSDGSSNSAIVDVIDGKAADDVPEVDDSPTADDAPGIRGIPVPIPKDTDRGRPSDAPKPKPAEKETSKPSPSKAEKPTPRAPAEDIPAVPEPTREQPKPKPKPDPTVTATPKPRPPETTITPTVPPTTETTITPTPTKPTETPPTTEPSTSEPSTETPPPTSDEEDPGENPFDREARKQREKNMKETLGNLEPFEYADIEEGLPVVEYKVSYMGDLKDGTLGYINDSYKPAKDAAIGSTWSRIVTPNKATGNVGLYIEMPMPGRVLTCSVKVNGKEVSRQTTLGRSIDCGVTIRQDG